MNDKSFLETWDIHNRINLYLVDAVAPASLLSLSASKGRNVGEQFAHIHNVRLMWLKAATLESDSDFRNSFLSSAFSFSSFIKPFSSAGAAAFSHINLTL